MTSSKSQIFRYLKMDNKNDLYTDIGNLFFENGKSPTLVKKALKKKYPDVKHLLRKIIIRIVTKF